MKAKTTEPSSKPKEILVLDPKRSNQINIGIRTLPPVSELKELIEKMEETSISRSGVEKLQNLIPEEGEVAQIKEAMREADKDIPLGTAEKFLLMMDSIPGLECRLKLWAFKVDFKVMEKDICEPLVALKSGISAVRSSQTFARLMAIVLAVGNFMNRSRVKGFQLEYLAKLSWVKDTMTKKSLLHHITQILMDQQVELPDLTVEFSELTTVARTDYDMLETTLAGMEEECKTSLGYVALTANCQRDTRKLVNTFLINAAERILSMQRVCKLVRREYKEFLHWLGIQSHAHHDYPPSRLGGILIQLATELSHTPDKIIRDKAKQEKIARQKDRGHRHVRNKMGVSNRSSVGSVMKRDDTVEGGDSSLPHIGDTHTRGHVTAPHNCSREVKKTSGAAETDTKDGLQAFLDEAAVEVAKERSGRRRRSRKSVLCK